MYADDREAEKKRSKGSKSNKRSTKVDIDDSEQESNFVP